jgi:hypothetical protein
MRMKGEDDGRWIWSKYFICMCENNIMKHIKTVKGGRIIRKDGGVDMIKVYYMYVQKHHNKPCCTILKIYWVSNWKKKRIAVSKDDVQLCCLEIQP